MKKLLLAVLLVAGCSDTTGGALIELPFQAGGAAKPTFTTPAGWTVTLQTAQIALGPFYFNVDPPPTDQFRGGVVIVEATEQTIVDTLDPTMKTVPGGADGETGTAVSVEIGLLTPMAPLASDVIAAPAFAFVAGSATNGAMTVPFAGSIVIDQALVTTTEPLADLQRIRGASVDLTFTAAPQTLELRVDPTHWFDQTDFSQLVTGAPPAAGYSWSLDVCKTIPAPASCTFATELLAGVKNESGVYLLSLSPG